MKDFPNLGVGIGLRPVHYAEILANPNKIDWFEIISEDYMGVGGSSLWHLEKILESYPVVMHGVSLAIGSAAPLDFDYLSKLKKLAQKTKTPWLSDHLSWGRLPGAYYHDLLPLPYTKEVVNYVVERAKIVQDFLEVPFALENVSSYVEFTQNEMPEWDFYAEIVERANILMMLDVNNIYVSSKNHGFDPRKYYRNLPLERVVQIHLAGHTDNGSYLLDTHSDCVSSEVWKLYGEIYPQTKGVSTLLEWDDQFISYENTCREAQKARVYQKQLEQAL